MGFGVSDAGLKDLSSGGLSAGVDVQGRCRVVGLEGLEIWGCGSRGEVVGLSFGYTALGMHLGLGIRCAHTAFHRVPRPRPSRGCLQ